jgi:beta-phosphoglucomutase
MKYKAIIFDFDGVLFDSEKIHLQACNHVFSDFGFTISEEEYFQHYVGLSDNEMFPLILNEKAIIVDSSKIKSLRQHKVNAYKEIINRNESLSGLPNLVAFIEKARRTINHFAICSGATREEIDTTINKLESGRLQKYFTSIIAVEDVQSGKPSPEGYLLAAKRLNIPPQFCLAIEDTPKGIHAAKSAGMDVAAITSSNAKSHLSEATFVADDFIEIANWFDN